MDNYPAAAAPEFNEGGGVETPFEEWWPVAQRFFPNVPESVAQFWLHEHWNRSPYRWLISKNYTFSLINFHERGLGQTVSRWDNFDPTQKECYEHGQYLTSHDGFGLKLYPTALFMLENRRFPSPIIIMDNHDGNMNNYSDRSENYPEKYILIEGHRRFNIATYLLREGRFTTQFEVWMMRSIQ